MSLLVVGALHWDVVVDADRLPRLGETLRGGGVDYRLGGKGGNQAIAAAHAGAKVAFAGRVGQDAPGRTMAKALHDAGVDTSQLQQGDGPSGMSIATTFSDGDYAAVIVSGENHAFDVNELTLPGTCRIVLTQNEMAPGLLAVLSEKARSAGAEFWVNLAPSAPIHSELANGLADVLIVNRVEAGDLLGNDIPDPVELVVQLQRIAPSTGCIVTLGGDGVAMKPKDDAPFHLPARPVDVVSTHGAGDAFCGVLAAARLARQNWPDAISTARDAATMFVAQIR